MNVSAKAEEILEALWIAVEEQGENAAHLSTLGVGPDDEALAELQRRTFVEVKGDRVYLRKEGRPEARMTVRRHRLAERLMMDILDVKGGEGNAKACELEHLLHEGVDTKICCEDAKRHGEVGVVALTELRPGQSGEIAYLSTDEPKKMQKLMSMGVLPGTALVLNQTFPSYIFKVGHSQFAVDQYLAREIFVRKT
jgi:DtxR family Mn-dependent transcriptional regulator